MTVADLITRALMRLSVYQAGEVPVPEDINDGFDRLNSMLGMLRLERLTIPYILRTTWTITSTKGTTATPYTVGTGGDINVARPPLPNAISVFYQDTSVSPTLERKLTPLTDDAYELIPQKDLTSPLPSSYYYSPTYSGSLGALRLWMVPTQSNLQGVLYAPAAIANFAATTDTIVLPDGYDLMLQENLAVLLWPEYGEGPVDPDLRQSALESKRAVKMANYRLADLSVDIALTAPHGVHYSIYTDSY